MAKDKISQKWLCASEKHLLDSETLKVSDFPDPLSLYALYCVIIKKEPMNKMVEYPFVPFRGRTVEEYVPITYGDRVERKDYAFWIGILVGFLGSPSLVEYTNDLDRTAQLTAFGKHIFPELMSVFSDLYQNNTRLRNAVLSYKKQKA